MCASAPEPVFAKTDPGAVVHKRITQIAARGVPERLQLFARSGRGRIAAGREAISRSADSAKHHGFGRAGGAVR